MLIKCITLNNFRQFKGKQTLEFFNRCREKCNSIVGREYIWKNDYFAGI